MFERLPASSMLRFSKKTFASLSHLDMYDRTHDVFRQFNLVYRDCITYISSDNTIFRH